MAEPDASRGPIDPGDPARGSARHTNRLADETSAYLRQHMHNPVDWHPWGEAALALARDRDCPLLVSIGYSACHWCHVMERESFEDAGTASLMNELFVNVKVDREERPDVDQIYMDTVVRLTGHGGWPLTVFCTPEGRPFYAGTYFPNERRHGMPSFREVLRAVAEAWRERRGEVDRSAAEITAALGERPGGVAQAPPGGATLLAAAAELMRGADREHGGFGGAPKFPTPTSLELLLAAADVEPDPARAAPLVDFVAFTCRQMARGGLTDHLGGGFHRYCVDARWGIPHFEKMLYDQGLLLRVYADTARRLALRAGAAPARVDEDLVWPVRETVGWLRREMRGEEGAFFASQDADSEGEEGRYYVWTPAQVEAVLGPERARAFCAAYGVDARGNFEGGTTHLREVAHEPRARFAAERAELRAHRAGRVPPATDRKRVAAWNGYAIAGLAFAGSVLDDDSLVDDAAAAAVFVLGRMRDPEGRLLRVFDGGRARVGAFLDDHAALLDAALALHRAGAGAPWLAEAVSLADAIAARFYDEVEGDLFLTPEDGERLPHRPRSDHDGATPHATGLAALGLLRVAELAGRGDLRSAVERVLRSHAFLLERAGHAFPTLLRAAALAERGLSVAVVVGDEGAPERSALARRARQRLGPDDAVVVAAPGERIPGLDPAWLAGREPTRGVPTAYLCRGRECSLPVTDPARLDALDLLP